MTPWHKDIKISLYLQAAFCVWPDNRSEAHDQTLDRRLQMHLRSCRDSPKAARWPDPKMGRSLGTPVSCSEAGGSKNLGMETIMKKFALAAVAVLGLAACQDNAADNNVSATNTVEAEAAADTNSALNATDNLGVAADNALDAAGNSVSNAGKEIENASEDVANGQYNVAGQ